MRSKHTAHVSPLSTSLLSTCLLLQFVSQAHSTAHGVRQTVHVSGLPKRLHDACHVVRHEVCTERPQPDLHHAIEVVLVEVEEAGDEEEGEEKGS